LFERDSFDLFLAEFDKPWVIHLRETCCCSTNICTWRPNTVYKNRRVRRHHNIENKFFPTMTNKNKPRSDLRDAKQQAIEIRSIYPCRSHSGNVQMNVVGVVVLASPPRDLIRSKRHNGRCLRALHTYSAATTPPPRSSKVWWSDRRDQQHNSVVLMVESIRGQSFAYAREVKEDRQKTSQTRTRENYR
jgi:hypothetical protein